MIMDVAVCGDAGTAVYVAAAAQLRRSGIAAKTFFSGSLKSQMRKSADIDAVVIAQDDVIIVRDMLLRRQVETTPQGLMAAVRRVLEEGLLTPEELAMTFDEYVDYRCAAGAV